MASIHKEIHIEASPETAWDALRDVGALHTRLVPGFVTATELEEGARMVAFGNGMKVRELIVDPSQPPTADNLKQAKLDVLARPYPRAVAGTPVSYAFHADTAERLFEFDYEADPAIRARTEVFVPLRQYPSGYEAVVSGPARLVSKPGARVLRIRAAAAGAVHLEVRRAAP